jgi:hypothetical protein
MLFQRYAAGLQAGVLQQVVLMARDSRIAFAKDLSVLSGLIAPSV